MTNVIILRGYFLENKINNLPENIRQPYDICMIDARQTGAVT